MYRVIAPSLLFAALLSGCGGDTAMSESTVVATIGEAQLTAGQLEAFLLQAPDAPTILQGQSVLSLWLDHAGLVVASADPSVLDDPATREAAMAPELLRQSIAGLASQTRGNRPPPTAAQMDSLGRLNEVRVFERFYIPLTDPNDTVFAKAAGTRMVALRAALGTISTEDFSLSRIPASMTSGVSRMRTAAMSRSEIPPDLAPELWRLEPGMASDLLVGEGAVQLFVRISKEEGAEQLKRWLTARLDLRADSIFVDSLATSSGLVIPDASLPRLRRLAQEPFTADGDEPLATFDGGSVTVAETRIWLGVMPMAARAALMVASDSGISTFLTESGKRAIMHRMAPEPDAAAVTAVAQSYAERLTALRATLASIPAAGDPSATTNAWIADLLAGRRSLVALPGALGVVLRDRFGATVNFEALEWVVQRAASAWAVKSGQAT